MAYGMGRIRNIDQNSERSVICPQEVHTYVSHGDEDFQEYTINVYDHGSGAITCWAGYYNNNGGTYDSDSSINGWDELELFMYTPFTDGSAVLECTLPKASGTAWTQTSQISKIHFYTETDR
jgi:hypothetical protein